MFKVAENLPVSISGEKVVINIYLNESGNIVLDGVGGVTHEMVNDELILMRHDEQ